MFVSLSPDEWDLFFYRFITQSADFLLLHILGHRWYGTSTIYISEQFNRKEVIQPIPPTRQKWKREDLHISSSSVGGAAGCPDWMQAGLGVDDGGGFNNSGWRPSALAFLHPSPENNKCFVTRRPICVLAINRTRHFGVESIWLLCCLLPVLKHQQAKTSIIPHCAVAAWGLDQLDCSIVYSLCL